MRLHPAVSLALSLALACSAAEDGTSEGIAASTQQDAAASTVDAMMSTGEPPSPTTSSDPTTSATSGGDATSSSGEPACDAGGVDDCCCFSIEGEPGHGVLSIGCTAGESVCEAPQASCPGGQVDCAAADLTIVNPAGLTCALAALEAGTPGPISWATLSEDGLGGRIVTLFVQAGRSAFSSDYRYQELEYTYSDVDRRTLKDAGFFSDCVAAPDDRERFDCLRRAVGEQAEQTCLDGFSGSAGRR